MSGNDWEWLGITVDSPILQESQGRMLDDISGLYSSVFGTKAAPNREKHPVVFLPDGSKKVRLYIISI